MLQPRATGHHSRHTKSLSNASSLVTERKTDQGPLRVNTNLVNNCEKYLKASLLETESVESSQATKVSSCDPASNNKSGLRSSGKKWPSALQQVSVSSPFQDKTDKLKAFK